MSLKHKAISGVFWSLMQKAGARVVTFLSIILLARLLTPEEFGLVGMITILIQVSQALVNGSFNQALIQKKTTDEIDYSTVFFINLFASITIFTVLFFIAPLIAKFYEQHKLVALIRVLALIFIINSFSYVQEARLAKEMNFKKLTYIQLPSSIAAGIISVIMASLGYGVWSLIVLQLAGRLLFAIQIWIHSNWKPLTAFDLERAQRLFGFGGRLMIATIIRRVYDNLYLVIIGKFFPLSSVGFYQNANNLVQYPTTTITQAVNGATFSLLSSIQDNDQQLKEGYKRIIQQLLFLMCPFFVLSGVLATPLFTFVFTEKWLPSVPYFQLLCIVGIFYPLNAYNLNIVNVKGRSDIYLNLEIVKKVFITIGIFLCLNYGIWVLVAFQALCSILEYLLNSYYAGKFIEYGLIKQIKDITPILGLNGFMGLNVWIAYQFMTDVPHYVQVIVGFLIGAIVYIGTAKVLSLVVLKDFLTVRINILKGF